MAGRIVAVLFLVAAVPYGWGAQPEAPHVLSSPSKDHLDRLNTYRTRILDPAARFEERRNWAEALWQEFFANPTDKSREAVTALLAVGTTPDIRRAMAIAFSIVAAGAVNDPDPSLAEAFFEILECKDLESQSAGAKALAEFGQVNVAQRLAKLVREASPPGAPEGNLSRRMAAVDALAANVDRVAVVELLVNLVGTEPAELGAKIVAALEPASREVIGNDPEAWKKWWERSQHHDEKLWLTGQIRMYRDRLRAFRSEAESARDRHRKQTADLAARLRDIQREVYRLSPPDQKETRLIEWLGDPHDEIKLTAVSIIKARIADEGRRPDADQLQALLGLIRQGSVAVRKEALSLAQNLNDPAVAKTVLVQLAEEQDFAVRESLLRAIGKLGVVEAIPILVQEITSEKTSPECIREAAVSLALIASSPEGADLAKDAAPALRARYQATGDHSVRSALLAASAAIADAGSRERFADALESDDPSLLRAAIQGFMSIREPSRISRLRRHTAHVDPLVRLAAVEAVGLLGKDDADVEALLLRMNPAAESSELVRLAAWKGYNELLRGRPVRERLRAAAMLRDVPERELEYLTALVEQAKTTPQMADDVEPIRERLANLFVAQGRFAEAATLLRESFSLRAPRNDPMRLEIGLRWLDAALRSPLSSQTPDIISQLCPESCDEYSAQRVVETVSQYIRFVEMEPEGDRVKTLLHELRSVRSESLGDGWRQLMTGLSQRVEGKDAAP